MATLDRLLATDGRLVDRPCRPGEPGREGAEARPRRRAAGVHLSKGDGAAAGPGRPGPARRHGPGPPRAPSRPGAGAARSRAVPRHSAYGPEPRLKRPGGAGHEDRRPRLGRRRPPRAAARAGRGAWPIAAGTTRRSRPASSTCELQGPGAAAYYLMGVIHQAPGEPGAGRGVLPQGGLSRPGARRGPAGPGLCAERRGDAAAAAAFRRRAERAGAEEGSDGEMSDAHSGSEPAAAPSCPDASATAGTGSASRATGAVPS